MFFKSLKKEMLVFTIGLIVVTIFVTVVLGVFSTQTAGSAAQKATEDVLREQAKESLVQIVESTAERQDLLFERVRDDASNFASYLKNIRDNPSIFSRNTYWEFGTRVFQKNGRYLNNTSDISTIHIPSFVALNSNEKKNIEVTAYLDFIAPSILKNNQNTVAIWEIDERGATRYFPNIILGNIAPPDYDPREDVFYKPATPQENPDKKVVWSSLYDDPAKRGLMITATAPVYTKNGFEGVIGIDVLLNSIIKTITAYSPIEGSYAFLIDKEGNTIAFPDNAYKDILGRPRKEGEVRTNLASSSQAFLPLIKEMTGGGEGFDSILSGDKELFVAYAPLKQTGFSMAIVAEKTVILKAVSALRREISNSVQHTIISRIVPVSMLIILLASIISIFLVGRIVKPIRELTLGAHEIGKGNLDYKLTIASKNEIGELASSFMQMSKNLKQSREELYEYSQGLEKKVKERTQELEQNNVHLQELTQELAETNRKLEEFDRQKSEFVSMAGHQLRAPMAVIKGYLSLIMEGTVKHGTQQEKGVLEKMMFSMNQMVKLIAGLLDLSRIESGKIHYEFAKGDFGKMVAGVIDTFKSSAEKRGIRIVFENRAGEAASFAFDANKMREVVVNLIDNAIKYSSDKSEVRVMEERVAGDGPGRICLKVRDAGIGIKPGDTKKLFVKFGRTDEAKKHDPGGMGIGLYFVKRIVQDHGGSVGVESEGIGKGSTFWIEVPMKARGS